MNYIKLTLFALIFTTGWINAQNVTTHPLKKYGYNVPVLTMTNGKHSEFFDDDSLVQIGTVILNTYSNKVVAFVKYDSTFIESGYSPDVSNHFISVDPHADRYYSLSPYVYAAGNPIRYNDPDGQDIIDMIEGFKDAVVSHFSFGLLGNGYNPMVRNKSDYQNARSFTEGMIDGVMVLSVLSGGSVSSPEVVPNGTSLVISTPTVSTIAPNAVVNAGGKYSDVKEPKNVENGKKTTSAQRQRLLEKNKELNDGKLKSDGDGRDLNQPKKVAKGEKADMNQAEVDHIKSRSKGGSNSNSNLRVISKEENLKKGNRDQ